MHVMPMVHDIERVASIAHTNLALHIVAGSMKQLPHFGESHAKAMSKKLHQAACICLPVCVPDSYPAALLSTSAWTFCLWYSIRIYLFMICSH